MCKRQQCPNFDKCKCNKDYSNVEGIPLTTSPCNLLNKVVAEDEHFDLNAVGVFDEENSDE